MRGDRGAERSPQSAADNRPLSSSHSGPNRCTRGTTEPTADDGFPVYLSSVQR